MELLIFFGAIWGAVIFVNIIVERNRSNVRENVTLELCKDFGLNQKLTLYKTRVEAFKSLLDEDIKKQTLSRPNPFVEDYASKSVFLGNCPDCVDGSLTFRKSKHGPFLRCSNFPKCNYYKPDKGLKLFKQKAKDAFNYDLHLAYPEYELLQ